MFALVDCNNFYASCERAFNPGLRNTPIVVLSNNDGCIIARSNEAKALGFKMGEPAYKVKALIEQHQAAVFSSNYTLYGDMSQRVMNCLAEFSPDIEIYSIDEAFIGLQGFDLFDLEAYCRKIRATVMRNTGIPVSIGIAVTKALAKLANHIAKKEKDCEGVFWINTEEKRKSVLQRMPVTEIWGVGRQYARLLEKNKLLTSWDFAQAGEEWVRKNMTVVGLRTLKELQGTSCLSLEMIAPDKKAICTSRSFGQMQTDAQPIAEAVATFASRCAAKLRKQKSCANVLMVFIHTNAFRKDLPQYARNRVVTLPVATNSSMEFVKYAVMAFHSIFQEGFQYKKAGIVVAGIVPEACVQSNCFDEVERSKQALLMKTLDNINNALGSEMLKIATQGSDRKWKLRQEKLSPCYTTRWKDIITIKT
ncbi:MAG: Y-family DNA polymerase [Bacteroidota bacterium]